MRGIQFVPYNTKLDFVRWRIPAFTLSALIVMLSIGSVFMQGLNYGIDFKGGFLIEIRTPEKADLSEGVTTASSKVDSSVDKAANGSSKGSGAPQVAKKDD